MEAKEYVIKIVKWLEEEEAKAIKGSIPDGTEEDGFEQRHIEKGKALAFAKVKRRLKLILM